MDLLQEQVGSLNVKVDALQQTVEDIKNQTAEVVSQLKSVMGDRSSFPTGSNVGRYSFQSRSFEMEMEHKDVLSDFSYPESDSQSGERTLSPEVQIQRLTAQLTAAYNRIAALEEQLLAKRIH
jgi:chaperonin cofactor prefoldin